MSEVFFSVPMGDGELEFTGENTSLFRHLGAAAVYDHLFVYAGEGRGGFMWRTHSQFEEVSELAVQALCTMHLNIREPAEVDVRRYMEHHTGDLAEIEGVPDEWVDGNSTT